MQTGLLHQSLKCSISHACSASSSQRLSPGLSWVAVSITGLLTAAAPFVARVRSDAVVGEHRLVFGVVTVLTAGGGDTLEGGEPDCFLQD